MSNPPPYVRTDLGQGIKAFLAVIGLLFAVVYGTVLVVAIIYKFWWLLLAVGVLVLAYVAITRRPRE